MKDSRRPSIFLCRVAGTVAGCYVALGLLVFLCGSLHPHSTHHHEPAQRSILCAWACQGTNSTSLVSLPSPLKPLLLIVSIFEDSPFTLHYYHRAFASSRAPPF